MGRGGKRGTWRRRRRRKCFLIELIPPGADTLSGRFLENQKRRRNGKEGLRFRRNVEIEMKKWLLRMERKKWLNCRRQEEKSSLCFT